jgi:hypothetical protein
MHGILGEDNRNKVLADLGLSGVSLSWEFYPGRTVPGSRNSCGEFSWRGGDYTIRLATAYSEDELLSTLAHECRHLWQKVTGVLDYRYCASHRRWGWYWNGSVYVPEKRGPVRRWGYENAPDERDARQYEREAVRRLFGFDYTRPAYSKREYAGALALQLKANRK